MLRLTLKLRDGEETFEAKNLSTMIGTLHGRFPKWSMEQLKAWASKAENVEESSTEEPKTETEQDNNNNEVGGETNGKIEVTSEWMQKKYDELNKTLFNGELGSCILRPFTTGEGSQGNTLGWFKLTRSIYIERSTRRMYINTMFGREYINKGNFVNFCAPCIELNGNYTATEQGFTATLAHEMCHYYTYMNGYAPKQGHGREFKTIGRIISNRSNGLFSIQRLASAEELTEWELKPEIQAKVNKRETNKKSKINAIFVFNDNGTIELTNTTSDELIDTIVNYNKTRVRTLKRGGVVKIVKSNDQNLINLLFSNGYEKSMRKYRYWNVENQPWIKNLDQYNNEVIYEKMDENRKLDKIIENTLNSFMDENFDLDSNDAIKITPDMNLGAYSPLELV